MKETAATPHSPDASLRQTTTFREARADEAAELAALINEAYLREAWLLPAPRTTEADVLKLIADPSVHVIVAEVEGTRAGTITVWLADEPDFGLFAVAPAFQGRGLASLLVGEAETATREAGFAQLRLDCAKELGLPPFYEALGYRVVREVPRALMNGKGPVTRVDMVKDLA
jgi:tRNA threonylcarbamoyladenosine biosynthesis protein TsaE